MKLLIDGDILVYRCGFAAEEDTVDNALMTVDAQLRLIVTRCGVSDYTVFLSGINNFREKVAITKPYKGNRKDARKPKHYEDIRGHLRFYHAAEVVDGIEADDAIGIAASTAPNERAIVSIDKDLDQIPGLHYNWVRDSKYTVSRREAQFKLYSQILTGDPTDNIPGLYGIGPKTAQALLDGAASKEELFERVWTAYRNHGKSWTYFLEQANLIYIHRKPNDKYEPPYVPDQGIGNGSVD